MIYRQNYTKYNNYHKWETTLNAPYDYKRKGILQHILSSCIVQTKNKITKFMLKVYEDHIVSMLEYVDELKNFKNYHWKNR